MSNLNKIRFDIFFDKLLIFNDLCRFAAYFLTKTHPIMENIHDIFAKEAFGNKNVFADLLRTFLDPELKAAIDFDTLQPSEAAFVTEDSKEIFSDII
jgi:Putative transposase, YhgA-like